MVPLLYLRLHRKDTLPQEVQRHQVAAATISPSTINIMALDCPSLPSQSSPQRFKEGSGVKTNKQKKTRAASPPCIPAASAQLLGFSPRSLFWNAHSQTLPGTAFPSGSTMQHEAEGIFFWWGRGRVSAKRRTSAMPSAPRSLRRSPQLSVYVHHPEAHTTAEHRSPGPSPRPEPGALPACAPRPVR